MEKSSNTIELHNSGNLELLRSLPADSVDSIVTDPPYGLRFMGNKWDYDVPSVELWQECLRVLKPGGYLLSFAGSRTYHRMVVRIEDAGFEIRDMIAWIYGSGFPKSHNISKAIDKAAGAEREEAKRWDGWGTTLKPAIEPIVMARKPLSEKTVAANVLKYGTGAINIDSCRVSISDSDNIRLKNPHTNGGFGHGRATVYNNSMGAPEYDMSKGRWPANIIHDGSDEVEKVFPYTKSGAMEREVDGYAGDSATGFLRGKSGPSNQHGDEGSASRFFYCAKASKKDRGEGNDHPTVKPTDLMKYLCRLVTPPGGTVLDPFMGSGSTGKAAILEGFDFLGVEINPEYFAIAEERINGVRDGK